MRNGEIVNDFPADITLLEGCTPVYEEFDGWTEDITNVKEYDKLPDAAKNYIAAIERLAGCKVSMIGVGPDRDQNITK